MEQTLFWKVRFDEVLGHLDRPDSASDAGRCVRSVQVRAVRGIRR
jgi:hypothetical protein